MKPITLRTEYHEGEAAKVGELKIETETIPVYEIIVKPKYRRYVVVKDGQFVYPPPKSCEGRNCSTCEEKRCWKEPIQRLSPEKQQDFLDVAQKLWDELQKSKPIFLAFIYSKLNRHVFCKVIREPCTNPVEGFVEGYEPDDEGFWLTWMVSEGILDKYKKDKVFKTALDKWALAKFLQLLFGISKLSFALPRYGNMEQEDLTFECVKVGGMLHENFELTPLPEFVYAFWDKEDQYWAGDTESFNRKITEQELDFLDMYLTRMSSEDCDSSERKQLYEAAKRIGK